MLRARTRHSFRRSRLRRRVFEHLRGHGRTDARVLMRELGVTWTRLREIPYGGTERYRSEGSPVGLGLVRPVRASLGLAFELTQRGHAEGRALDRLDAARVPL